MRQKKVIGTKELFKENQESPNVLDKVKMAMHQTLILIVYN